MIFRKKEIDKETARLAEEYLSLFTSAKGISVLADLKRQYDLHSVWPDDPIAMAKLAGMQSVYKRILATMSLARAIKRGEITIQKIEKQLEEAV